MSDTQVTQVNVNTAQSAKWLWKVIIPLVLVAGGLWVFFNSASLSEQQAATVTEAVEPAPATNDLEPAPAIGHPAPDFTLVNMAGEPVSLSDFRGQPVIVNFWATWCGPCRLEMPHLQESFAEHEAAGLVVLGVNLTQDDDVAAIPEFIDEFGLTFPIILDEEGQMRKLYELPGQPASVFIDRDGIITEFWRGPINQQFIEERLAKIL